MRFLESKQSQSSTNQVSTQRIGSVQNLQELSFQEEKSLQPENNKEFTQHLTPKISTKSLIRSDQCQICLQKSQQEMICPFMCEHFFCLHCLQQHVKEKISSYIQVQCPQDTCKEILPPTSDIFTGMPQVYHQWYQKGYIWRKAVESPFLKFCSAPNCINGVVDTRQELAACNECHKHYSQKQIEELTKNLEISISGKKVKPCPRCRAPIQKKNGCNQMTCKCSHEFCYICLADWNKQHNKCFDESESWNFLNCFHRGQNYKLWLTCQIMTLLLMVPLSVVAIVIGFVLIIIAAVGLITASFGVALVKTVFQIGYQASKGNCLSSLIMVITLPGVFFMFWIMGFIFLIGAIEKKNCSLQGWSLFLLEEFI